MLPVRLQPRGVRAQYSAMARTRTIKEDCTRLANKQQRAGLSQDKRRALGIYLESLLQRVKSVEYAYRRVSNLSRATATESTDPTLGSSAAELDFYCDAFWAFAYSTFDLVAHVVNVVYPSECSASSPNLVA